MKAVFDTNILVDYLKGIEAARVELGRYDWRAVSVVTWIEIMVGTRDEEDEIRTRGFLDAFEVEPVDAATAEEAVRLRRAHRIRVPDALIWATARTRQALFVTRNTKDFPADDPAVRIPYTL